MAILKKRTSSKQLPEARGLERAPLDSVIRNLNSAPSLTGRDSSSITSGGGSGGSNSITSSGGAGAFAPNTSTNRPVLTTGTTTKPTLTSTTKPATTKPTTTTRPITTKPSVTTKPAVTTKPTTTKPTTGLPKPNVPKAPVVTTKTPTTPTTKTTPTSVVKKPTVTPIKTNTNSTANKVTNALTGAVLGAGTKMIIDKVTGKPVVKPPTGGTPKPPVGGTPKPPVGGTPKPPAGSTAKPPAGGTPKPPTSTVKPPVGGSSTLPSATDIYKGTPADPSLGLPEGAIDNGDGTYTVGGTTYSMENDSVLYTTDADGNITVGDGGGGGTNVVGKGGDGSSEEQYYEDGSGNIYTMNDDGGYDLYRAAEVDEDISAEDAGLFGNSPVEEEEQYYDDGEGNIYTLNDDGEYDLYRAAEVDEDISEEDYDLFNSDTTVAENSDSEIYDYGDSYDYAGYDYGDSSDYDVYDYGDSNDYASYDYGDYDYAKRGGLITMMKNGGVPRFEDGGYSDTGEEVQDWQNVSYNYGEYDDPSLTGDKSLYSQSDPVNNSYLRYSTPVAMASSSSDDSYVDNGDGTYTIGNFTYDMMTDEYMYSTDPDTGQITNVSPDYSYSTDPVEDYYDTDSLGNVFKNGEFYRAADVPEDATSITDNVRPNLNTNATQRPITNVGGGTANTKKDVYQTDAEGNVFKNGVFYRAAEIPDAPLSGLDSDFLSTLTSALGTTAGAAGAGALVASLLGSDFGGGGSGAQNQGVDMSQVGVINPRTTDFGIGPTNFVGYDQYGTDDGDYTPNEELLRNLNAPGYNPVNEGDYGYEEVPTEETAEEPAMASGGLSSMSTPVASYYTFGQPADILANLGMRPQPPMNPPEMMPQIGQQKPPQQMQQQGLPQQMPPQMAQQMPQGMPQQGMMPQQQGMPPPMRRGGLPHASDVPMTQGRMDFRQGAAVHGEGDGQSDDIPAMLADGEYVIDSETVAQIGNGSTKAGAQALDKFRESIRAHKRSAPVNKIPPKTKALTSYLKGAR